MSSEIENILRRKIQESLTNQHIALVEQILDKVARSLQIEPIQAAAAIACMDHTDINLQALLKNITILEAPLTEIKSDRQKMVRYRLEVGRVHEISTDDITTVLINESGVERTKIGYLDIRAHYTLIDLPNGMPADIFQHLQSVQINEQPLKIKRVGSAKKRQWQRLRRKNSDQTTQTLSKAE